MNLKQAALVAEIVGAAGVIISIIYLASEVSQNTASIRASNTMAMHSERAESVRMLIENPDLVELSVRMSTADGELSPEEEFRYRMAVNHWLDQWEMMFSLASNDLIFDESVEVGYQGYCNSLRNPSVAAVFFENAESGYHRAAFVEYAKPCFEGLERAL